MAKVLVPTAFLSYSWDDDDHKKWIHDLAARLYRDGILVTLDQWNLVTGDQLPQFMETAVRDNEYVIIICTPNYKERSDGRRGGVGYEGDVITAEVMTFRNQRKFIPVLRRGEWKEAAPSWLLGKVYVNMWGEDIEAGYATLVRTIRGTTPKPPPFAWQVAPSRSGATLVAELVEVEGGLDELQKRYPNLISLPQGFDGGDDTNPDWDEYLEKKNSSIRPYLCAIRTLVEEQKLVGTRAAAFCNNHYFSFNDGTTINFSWRAWGDFMQAIVGKREGYLTYY